MQSTTTKSSVIAKTLVLTLAGATISFYFFKTTNAAIIGGVIGLALSIWWQ